MRTDSFELRGDTAIVRPFSPGASDELSGSDIVNAVRAAHSDGAVSAVVIVIDGRRHQASDPGPELLDAAMSLPTPVVAVLDGVVEGIGLLTACLADLRIATSRAAFTGTGPGLSHGTTELLANLLAQMVGTGHLPEALLGLPRISVRDAARIGLVNVVTDQEGALAQAIDAASQLTGDQVVHLRASKVGAVFTDRSATAGPTDASSAAGSAGPPALRVVVDTQRSSSAGMRQRILDAAAEVLAEVGYRSCRLSDIAAVCGTHQTSIYHYFESKDALVRAVLLSGMAHAFDVMRSAIAALPDQANGLDRIATAIHAHLDVTLGSSHFSAAAMRLPNEMPEHLVEALRADQRRYDAYWSDLFRRARDEGVIRADLNLSLARSFVAGALNNAIAWYKPHKLDVDTVAEEFITMIIGGLASEGARTERPLLSAGPVTCSRPPMGGRE